MEQRDLLKQEIEKFGQAIGKLVAKLIGTEANNLPPQEWRTTIEAGLASATELTLQDLMDLDEEALLRLINAQNITGNHLEQLGDLFFAWAQTEQLSATRKLLAERSLLIFGLSARVSGNYCFQRAQKEADLTSFISNQTK